MASSLLGTLFIALVRLPGLWREEQSSSVSSLDSGGVLQITWLLGQEKLLSTVSEPNTISLRRAGMFPVHMDAVAKRRIYLASSSDTLSIQTDDDGESKTV